MNEQIIALLRAGEQQGLALLQQHYGAMVRYIVRGILPDARDAEECVSDVFLRVWERFSAFDETRGSFNAWLTAIARNAAVDYRRRRGEDEHEWDGQAGASPSPEDELLRREQARLLHEAIARLSPAEQQLFYRKYYYLQSNAQMAAELGLSERAVEGRLYRLRARLRRLMGGDGS